MFRKGRRFVSFLCGALLVISMTAESVSAEGVDQKSSTKLDPTKSIKVDGGKITGTLSSDSEVAIYKGIPYAAPPIGNLRWKAPQPVVSWTGVKKCKEFGASDIQSPQAPFMMWSEEFIIDTSKKYSEDCLTLNVWSKTKSETNKRPVVVFIHGGGFTSGGSSCDVYDGEALAKKDVVFVSINYRVGIFGFLAHPKLSAESKDGVSGNYGILDQVEALKWVKKNISKFGGDPGNVTIVGQSAGSASVDILTMSPKAKGLFKNAVSMSFNLIQPKLNTMANMEKAASKVFKGKTLKDMRNMSTDELLNVAKEYSSAPCVDGKVIPDYQLNLLKEGTANEVNVMTGMVTGDTLLFTTLPVAPFTSTIKKAELISLIKTTFGKYAEQCLALYPVDTEEAMSQCNEINRDGNMALQAYLAKARALNSKKATYIYQFSHTMPGENSAMYGAFHTADVPYFFNHFSSSRKSYWTQTDYDLGDKMSSYLVNFAKTGNPNGENLETWNAYDGNISFLDLGDKISTTTFSKEKEKLWQDYLKDLYGL